MKTRIGRRRMLLRGGLGLIAAILILVCVLAAAWQHTRTTAMSARTLAKLRAQTPDGMALVPAGDCLLGTNDSDAEENEKPMRSAFVPSFYIDMHEVTNAEYRRFDPSHTFKPDQAKLPVTNVTYDEAAAYAKWAGKRLPTEEEWEKAARGTDGRRYPWGNTWDVKLVAPRARRKPGEPAVIQTTGPKSCFIGAPRVQPVGSVPGGVSPYGCYDMAGNAWEWVQGFYDGNPNQRILRGGAVGYGDRACRTYSRSVEGAAAT